jgi:hypothetical protein
MDARALLETASRIVTHDRNVDYGEADQVHANIAALWNAYLSPRMGEDALSPQDVMLMMALLKIARTKLGTHKNDNYVDACGYLALAGQLAGERASPVEITLPEAL